MHTCHAITFALALLLSFSAPRAAAQDAPAPTAQDFSPALSALLERIEFNQAESPDDLGEALVALPLEDWQDLLTALPAPESPNPKISMALEALVWKLPTARQPQKLDHWRKLLAERLTRLRPSPTAVALLRFAALTGDDTTVPAVAPFLTSASTADHAARALASIGGLAAERALSEALRDRDALRLRVLQTLRDIPVLPLAPEIINIAQSAAQPERDAALRVLAAMDSPEATAALQSALNNAAPSDRATHIGLLIEHGANLIRRRQINWAADVYRDLYERALMPTEVHVRCAAVAGLAQALGASALPDISAALTSDHPELHAAALRAAVALPGDSATRALVASLAASDTSPAQRAALLDVLTARRDRAIAPELHDYLTAPDATVRAAAIRAVTRLGRLASLEPLLAAAPELTHAERDLLTDELTRLSDPLVDPTLATALAGAAPPARVILLNALTRRGATSELEAISAYANDDAVAVRIAAYQALGALASPNSAQRLVPRLRTCDNDRERETLESAIVALVARADAPDLRVLPYVAAINRAELENYQSLLRIIAQLGGAPAREALATALEDDRDEVVTVALRALADWPNAAVAPLLIELAESTESLKRHVLALRSFASVAPRAADEEAAELFATALAITRRDDERRLLLTGLSRLASPAALNLATTVLREQPNLAPEAGAAVLTIAENTPPAHWERQLRAADAVLTANVPDFLRQRAATLQNEANRRAGFLLEWHVSGPYYVADKRGNQIFNQPFPPESEPASAAWKPQPVNPTAENFWLLDLNASTPSDDAAAYLRTYLHLDEARPVRFEFGSDDGLKVWLNREVLHANNALRGCSPAQDILSATLRAGWNELLLKVTNNSGGFAACARVRMPDGSAVAGLKSDPNPTGKPTSWPKAEPTVQKLPPPTAEQQYVLAAALRPLPHHPPSDRRVLIFTRCVGYQHPVNDFAAYALKRMGKETGAFEATVSNDPLWFADEHIHQFDAICFLNTTGNLFDDPTLRANLLQFVTDGKGFVGVHAATDCFYEWTHYGEMIGAYFDGHPWNANDTVGIRVDEPDHPLCTMFTERSFQLAEEIYQFRAPYSRDALRVLLSLDPDHTDMSKAGIKRADGDFAVSWIRDFGAGRVFYCALGHNEHIFTNTAILHHYYAGFQYALGDLTADATPSAIKHRRDWARANDWQVLFNGRDLTNWQGLVGNPESRATLSADNRAAQQAAADETMRAHWSVRDGLLHFDGSHAGENICTARDFQNFELIVDWRIADNGDSGIYLRGTPQVQIWDAFINNCGSGGLYNNTRAPSKPLRRADFPIGSWNTFRIQLVDDIADVWLNNQRVVLETPLDNYWNRAKPLYPSGPLELQAHQSPLWFHNVIAREIDQAEAARIRQRRGDPWQDLLAAGLKNWTCKPGSWTLEDGVLTRQGGDYVWTNDQFEDFILELEFRISAGGNSGIFFRTADPRDPVQTGIELQVLDSHDIARPGKHHCGAIYDIAPPRRNAVLPANEWNHVVLTCRGSRIEVVLNGELVNDLDLAQWTEAGQNPDGSANKFSTPYAEMPRRGHIGFQDHGNPVWYRNIRIKPLR